MKKNTIPFFMLFFLIACGKNDESADVSRQNIAPTQLPIESIVAIGRVEPETQIIKLASPLGGIVKETFKINNEPVKEGEYLVALDNELELLKVQEIAAQVSSQNSQIAVEEMLLKEIEINLKNKESLLLKTKRLVENGSESRQVLEDLLAETAVLEVSRDRAKAQILLAKKKLEELKAQLKTAEIEANKRYLTSPFNGVLLDMQVNKGESIAQLSTFAELAPEGNLFVRAEVDELFDTRVDVGQKVDIYRIGTNQIAAIGEVVSVGSFLKRKSLFSESADDQEDRRVREILIALIDANDLLINAKVECRIKL